MSNGGAAWVTVVSGSIRTAPRSGASTSPEKNRPTISLPIQRVVINDLISKLTVANSALALRPGKQVPGNR
jgi:hypothetical protein